MTGRAQDEHSIVTMTIEAERDLVAARRRASSLAELLGFVRQDGTRIATAVSEIARNAFRYAGGGRIEYLVRTSPDPAMKVVVSDNGPGIGNLRDILGGRYRSMTGMGMGIVGAQRLMDGLTVESSPGAGTRVTMEKLLPRSTRLTATDVAGIADEIAREAPRDAYEELRQQNQELSQELLRMVDEMQQRQDELVEMNKELEDTNRGVVALYAELDERAERLRQSDEIKSRFLSNMSHEFRTPLNSIIALSRLLIERTDGDLTSEQEKQVTFIRKSAQDLTELVNDLLDIAKVEAGRTELNVMPFDVQDLLGALRGVLRPLLTDDSVSLVFEPAPSGLRMESDEGKIAQIVRNLVSNALKFTEHGEVRVAVRVSDDGEWVSITVSDTGIGIDSAHVDIIFEEFGQVRNRFQQKVKGTGLGLPLSRRLAELLGGSLTVESTPGAGSVFSVRLPRRIRSKEQENALAEIDPVIPLVLIIDDEDATRYYLTKMAADVPFSVVTANGGAKGVEEARKRPPDAILLDLIMPEVDGFEVVRRLRSHEDTASIPIVIVTSKTLTQAERAFIADQRLTLISKQTVTREIIAETVNSLLASRAAAGDTAERSAPGSDAEHIDQTGRGTTL